MYTVLDVLQIWIQKIRDYWLERVEADLNKSKQVREKQAREFQKQLDEGGDQHERRTSINKERERLHQLLADSEQTVKTKANLERENIDVESKLARLSTDVSQLRDSHKNLEREHQIMIEAHNQEMRTIKNETDASLELIKQEHNLSSAKATDTISDLEQSVDQLREAVTQRCRRKETLVDK